MFGRMFFFLFKRLLLITLLASILLANGVAAQDPQWTCDEGANDVLNAAQAAFDSGDKATAWTLSAQAQVLCLNNADRFKSAQKLNFISGPNSFKRLMAAKPGKVNIGDYSLFMDCIGEGSPTIIFENGLEQDFMGSWGNVQPAMSTVTRTCAYDRLGQGSSDLVPAGKVRTVQDGVNDLVALLKAAEIDPPYILVGHSFGGLNALLFADQYPDAVDGVVLVDAFHPDMFKRFAEADPTYVIPAAGVPEQDGGLIPAIPFIEMSPEQLDWVTSAAQAADLRSLGDRPLAVVSAGGSIENAAWKALQENFLTYSSNSTQIIAEESLHFVMGTEPERVIEAALWVVDEARKAESGK